MTTVTTEAPVYIVRDEKGGSCGHDHATDVTGKICLADRLEEARRHRRAGAVFTLNRCLSGGDEDVLRVCYA